MATKTGLHPWRTLICLLVVIAALGGLMALGKTWTPRLGLDLRGGTTITLTASNTTGNGQIDPASLEQARTIIQNRVDSLGVGESEVTTSGDSQIVVSVPNVQQDELIRLVGQTAVLRFRAVYAAEAVAPEPVETPSASPTGESSASPPSSSPSASSGSQSPSASQTPAASQPAETPQASVSPTGNGRPLPQLPTAPPTPREPRPTEAGKGTPPDQAISWQPTEDDNVDFASHLCSDPFPDVSDQPLITCNRERTEKYLLGPTLIEGSELKSASAGVPQGELTWIVNLGFNTTGASKFEAVTGAIYQRPSPQNQFAIVLDGEVIEAPAPNGPIAGGEAQISGNFNQASAQELANVLKYGALPLAFDVSSVDNVSASLGGEQLHAGMIAGIIGLALVILFCLLYYRALSLVVVASLAVAAALTYASMTLLGSTVGFALNLPGIAGAIVAIGVTADSFVIYFERIRDEVRDGRSLRTAVETGWRRARQTVLIADAVSMLSAVILFILAIGSVKGFAFTLGLTTVIDVCVVFFFTKPLMTVLAKTKFFGRGHKLSGLDPAHLGVTLLPGTRGATTRVGTSSGASVDPEPKEA